MNWFEESYRQLSERNSIQTLPYVEIFKSHEILSKKLKFCEANRKTLSHQVSILMVESTEQEKAGNVKQLIENFKSSLNSIHSTLSRDYDEMSSSYLKTPPTNLTKIIFDQRILIADQVEEIKLFKTEKIIGFEKQVELEAQLKQERELVQKLQCEIEEIRNNITNYKSNIETLQKENTDLINRIMSEKNRTADELNQMNLLIDGFFIFI
jgi:hypothetical protein